MLGLTAGLLAGTAVTASAALLDFTDLSNFSYMGTDEARGNVGNIYFRVTGNKPKLTYNTGPFEAPGPVPKDAPVLVGEGDGIGISDDEVSPREYLVLELFSDSTFSTPLANKKLTAVHFLDLYAKTPGDDSPEDAYIYVGAPPPGAGLGAGPIFGEQVCCSRAGYKLADGLSLTGSVFSFDNGDAAPKDFNDNAGVRDFALGAVEVQAIPLPAGVLLMGTALAGLGFARRRKV